MYRKKRFFVAYDISKTKIRTKVQKKLLSFGFRMQYSNYLCEFFIKDLVETQRFIKDLIEKNDSIIWIPITDPLLEKIKFQGKTKKLETDAIPKIFF